MLNIAVGMPPNTVERGKWLDGVVQVKLADCLTVSLCTESPCLCGGPQHHIRRVNCQVMLAAGAIMVVLQLVVFPRVLKVLKFTICQRIGCILAVPAFIAVPYGKSLSWNDRSLFVVSVASTSLVYCSTAVVSRILKQYPS